MVYVEVDRRARPGTAKDGIDAVAAAAKGTVAIPSNFKTNLDLMAKRGDAARVSDVVTQLSQISSSGTSANPDDLNKALAAAKDALQLANQVKMRQDATDIFGGIFGGGVGDLFNGIGTALGDIGTGIGNTINGITSAGDSIKKYALIGGAGLAALLILTRK